MRRLVCWLRGHRWDILAVNVRKNVNLFHLHHLAGCKAMCRRCGADWDDLWSPWFGDEVVYPSRRALPLPEARLVP